MDPSYNLDTLANGDLSLTLLVQEFNKAVLVVKAQLVMVNKILLATYNRVLLQYQEPI